MSGVHFLFPQDKNYILKEVQTDAQSDLLSDLVLKVKDTYLSRYNPLDVEDDTIRVIKNCKKICTTHLDNFYWELAGIYRYKIGSNQLEFIFSGRSHYDKYIVIMACKLSIVLGRRCRQDSVHKRVSRSPCAGPSWPALPPLSK